MAKRKHRKAPPSKPAPPLEAKPAGVPVESAGKSRLRPLLVSVALLLAFTAAGALVLEGAARKLWKAPWYEQLLAEQRRVQQFEYNRNSVGLRDRDYASEKPSGVKRVFILGDSFTFGLGVPDDEAIFPQVLERRLNERARELGADSVEVLNSGLPATLTGHWVGLWEKNGKAFRPDAVVVVFFLRDGTESEFIPEYFMRIRREIVARNEASFAYRTFYSYRVVRDWRDRQNIGKNYARHFMNAYFGNERETAEWQRAKKNLALLRDQVRAHGARFGLVVFPVLVELHEDYPFQPICELLDEFGRSMGVPVYDLFEDFNGMNASDLWVSPWDQHPNPKGHAIVAEAIQPFVEGLLREP